MNQCQSLSSLAYSNRKNDWANLKPKTTLAKTCICFSMYFSIDITKQLFLFLWLLLLNQLATISFFLTFSWRVFHLFRDYPISRVLHNFVKAYPCQPNFWHMNLLSCVINFFLKVTWVMLHQWVVLKWKKVTVDFCPMKYYKK